MTLFEFRMPAPLPTFGLTLFWTLPFPSWQVLISVVSSTLMLSYAFAPLRVATIPTWSARSASEALPCVLRSHSPSQH